MLPSTSPAARQTSKASDSPVLSSAPQLESTRPHASSSTVADGNNVGTNMEGLANSAPPLSKMRPRYAQDLGSRGIVAPPDLRWLGLTGEMSPQDPTADSTNTAQHPALVYAQAQDASTSWISSEGEDWDWDVLEALIPCGEEKTAFIHNAIQSCRSTVAKALHEAQLGQAAGSARHVAILSAHKAFVVQAVSSAVQWIDSEISGATNRTDMNDLLRKCNATKGAAVQAVTNTFNPRRKTEIAQRVKHMVEAQKMSPVEAGAAVALQSAQSVNEYPDLEHVVRLSSAAAASVYMLCVIHMRTLLPSETERRRVKLHIRSALRSDEQGRKVLAYLQDVRSRLGPDNKAPRDKA